MTTLLFATNRTRNKVCSSEMEEIRNRSVF